MEDTRPPEYLATPESRVNAPANTVVENSGGILFIKGVGDPDLWYLLDTGGLKMIYPPELTPHHAPYKVLRWGR